MGLSPWVIGEPNLRQDWALGRGGDPRGPWKLSLEVRSLWAALLPFAYLFFLGGGHPKGEVVEQEPTQSL